MARCESCEGCTQAHDCREIYQQLGDNEGPSVAPKAVIAFLLPILVFVVALGSFSRLLTGVLAQRYQAFVAFVLALSVTVGSMLVARLIVRRRQQNSRIGN